MAKQINTVLSLKDKISQPLVKVSKNVDKVTREMKRSQNQIEKWKNKSVKAIDNVIKKTVKLGAATTAVAGGFAVKVGWDGLKKLDGASAKVKSIARDQLDLKNIQNDLLKSSNKTGIVIEELADTQYNAISSGIKAAESMDAAVLSSKLALGGFTDSTSAIKVMTSQMDVFGMSGAKAMEEISDKLLMTQDLANDITVADLSNTLGGVSPIAKAVGLNIDELLGSVGALSKSGMDASLSTTALKGMMTNIIKPSKQASDMAKSLGIEFSTSAIKTKGWVKWVEELKEKTGGSEEVLGKLFGNANALSGALALTGDNFKLFSETVDSVGDSAGLTDEKFEIMTNSIGYKMDKFKNRMKNTFTSIMNTQSGAIGENIDKIDAWLENNEEKIQGWIQSIGEGVTQMIDFVKNVVDFVKEHEKTITTIMVFIGAMYGVIKVITLAISVMEAWKTISMVLDGVLKMSTLGWLVLAIAGVVAAGYLLYRNWDLIKEKAGELWVGVKEAFAPWGEFFSGLWEGIKSGFRAFINFIIRGLNAPIKALNKIKVDIPDWVPKIGGNSFNMNIQTIPEFAKGTSYSPAGYARIHEEGGEIRKLSSGETIIPADKSERLLRGKGTGQDVNIIIKILGNVIGNQEFIDEVGYEVYRKIVLALDNI